MRVTKVCRCEDPETGECVTLGVGIPREPTTRRGRPDRANNHAMETYIVAALAEEKKTYAAALLRCRMPRYNTTMMPLPAPATDPVCSVTVAPWARTPRLGQAFTGSDTGKGAP
jgi:hypothetical protein